MRNKQHLYKTKEVHTGKGRGARHSTSGLMKNAIIYWKIPKEQRNQRKFWARFQRNLPKEPTKGTKEPEANKLINQSDKPTKGTKGTDGVTFSDSNQSTENNTDTEMCHPTVTKGVTNQRIKGTNDKSFDIAGLDDSTGIYRYRKRCHIRGGRTHGNRQSDPAR